jgi:hypothetical protein
VDFLRRMIGFAAQRLMELDIESRTGSAMFLILDMSQPYAGLFRIPSSATQQTIEAIDK